MIRPAIPSHCSSSFSPLRTVVLAPFVGAFMTRAQRTGDVHHNLIKVVGCSIMLLGVSPLMAMVIVGLGAAAYSPAKYGIMTDWFRPRFGRGQWLDETLTVLSIIFTVLGGFCPSPGVHIADWALSNVVA